MWNKISLRDAWHVRQVSDHTPLLVGSLLTLPSTSKTNYAAYVCMREAASLPAALLLSISPWALHLQRDAIRGIRNRSWLLMAAPGLKIAGGGARVAAARARSRQSRPGRRGLHIPTSLCCRSTNQWLSDRLQPVRRKCSDQCRVTFVVKLLGSEFAKNTRRARAEIAAPCIDRIALPLVAATRAAAETMFKLIFVTQNTYMTHILHTETIW